jgi:hypothetical protein
VFVDPMADGHVTMSFESDTRFHAEILRMVERTERTRAA